MYKMTVSENVHKMLTEQYGWQQKHINNTFTYYKLGDETTSFSITSLDNDKCIISIPLINSVYQYTNKFDSYVEAEKYLEEKIQYYCN
jgi:hypothetical protein